MSSEGTAVSSQLLKKLFKNAAKTIPVIQQANLGQKILGKASKEIVGYDFFGLMAKMAFFYSFSFLILKYFEAVIFGSGIVQVFAKLAGMNLNPALPDSVVTFFKNGITLRKGDLTKD